jgi:hypothetical protein
MGEHRDDPAPTLPGFAAHVVAAGDLRCSGGANQGDGLGPPDSLEAGDTYRIRPDAVATRLMLAPRRPEERQQRIAPGSQIGRRGDPVELVGRLTFLAPDGDRVEVLCLRHVPSGAWILPLTPMTPRIDYTLVDVQTDPGDIRIADLVCVAFAAGTRITISGGSLVPIERLQAGDLVVTRDSGDQPVRWVGRATLRATGAFAPVVVSAGTLANLGDLVLSPHHRLFIYQRGRRRAGGVPDILVQAKHLVDDEFVRRREGGYVDYYSLVFDRHEIVYAEGIPVESLMINEATLAVLPEPVAEELRTRFPGLRHRQHFGTEIGRSDIEEFGREALYRFPRKP